MRPRRAGLRGSSLGAPQGRATVGHGLILALRAERLNLAIDQPHKIAVELPPALVFKVVQHLNAAAAGGAPWLMQLADDLCLAHPRADAAHLRAGEVRARGEEKNQTE